MRFWDQYGQQLWQACDHTVRWWLGDPTFAALVGRHQGLVAAHGYDARVPKRGQPNQAYVVLTIFIKSLWAFILLCLLHKHSIKSLWAIQFTKAFGLLHMFLVSMILQNMLGARNAVQNA